MSPTPVICPSSWRDSSVWPSPIPWCSASLPQPVSTSWPEPVSCTWRSASRSEHARKTACHGTSARTCPSAPTLDSATDVVFLVLLLLASQDLRDDFMKVRSQTAQHACLTIL